MIKSKHFFVGCVVCCMSLAACSGQNLTGAGSSTSTSSGPTQAVVNIINSQATLVAPATQPSEPQQDTPTPVTIATPTPWIVTATALSPVAVQAATEQSVPACTNRAEVAEDLNLFGIVALDAGQHFAKLWRIKNTGTCTWTTDYTLAFYSGEQMGSQASMPLPAAVQPGETIDLRLGLIAPFGQIQPTGNWVLKDANGAMFGVGETGDHPLSVTILVRPTPEPTSGCVACDRLRHP